MDRSYPSATVSATVLIIPSFRQLFVITSIGVCVCESNHRGANVSWHANAIPAPEGHARRATKITIRFPLPYLFRYACLPNSYICQCNGHTWARFCGTEKRHKSDDDSFALLSSQFLGILSWCNRRPSRMMHYPNKNTPFAPRRAKKKQEPETHAAHTHVPKCAWVCGEAEKTRAQRVQLLAPMPTLEPTAPQPLRTSAFVRTSLSVDRSEPISC